MRRMATRWAPSCGWQKLVAMMYLCLAGATTTEKNHPVDLPSPAQQPPPPPPPRLPWGDINVLVVTDVHSWVASQQTVVRDSEWNVNYGHVKSFVQHLRQYATSSGKPFFFVMNGDFMDGTGLAQHPPSDLIEILKQMPFDAMTIGNHELYENSTMEAIRDELLPHFSQQYLTTNVFWKSENHPPPPLDPIGSRYAILHHEDTNVLVFGFLYDMRDTCDMVQVERVESLIQGTWFRSVTTTEEFDAILILAHMDVSDHLVYLLHSTLRESLGPDMPIQFLTGHTHYRGYRKLDDASTSVEAGKYLDTIGFVSFPTQKHLQKMDRQTEDVSKLFRHEFLDATTDTLRNLLQLGKDDSLMTKDGLELQALIEKKRNQLDLPRVLGCSPAHFYFGRDPSQPQSLWQFYLAEVIQEDLFQNDPTKIFVAGKGGLRYDLSEGEVTNDEIMAISPFEDSLYEIATNLTSRELLQILTGDMDWDDSNVVPDLPRYFVSLDVLDPKVTNYSLYGVSFRLEHWENRVRDVTGKAPQPVSQNITTTELWQRHVQTYMPCNATATMTSTRGQRPNPIAHYLMVGSVFFSAMMIMSLLWWWWWWSKCRLQRCSRSFPKTKRGYHGLITSEVEDEEHVVDFEEEKSI